MLEAYLRQRLQTRKILLMTHIVLGYPSFAACEEIVAAMVEAGVDIMELQIPFSEPIADGPVILRANQEALAGGATVQRCIDFAAALTARHPIPFLFMTYANIVYRRGVHDFVAAMAAAGVRGAIVPDLPPEEGADYLKAMAARQLAPVMIFAPTTPEARLHYLGGRGRGLVYCVARKGVTGKKTQLSADLDAYLQRCRQATTLPLAVGFGIQERADVDFLVGRADIAVIGTQTIRIVETQGVEAVGSFVASLRPGTLAGALVPP